MSTHLKNNFNLSRMLMRKSIVLKTHVVCVKTNSGRTLDSSHTVPFKNKKTENNSL